jgi:cell division protein FtsN
MKPKHSPDRRKSGGNTLVGVFIGLVLGVAIAAGVVMYINKTPLPFINKVQPAPRADSHQAPVALPGKPGDPTPTERPSQLASVPPNAEATRGEGSAQNEAARPEAQGQKDKLIYFQAGAFSQPQDADRLKANLALMGLEADVQQVMVQNKTFYRLRLGPYTKIRADSVRAELAQAGIETALIGKE